MLIEKIYEIANFLRGRTSTRNYLSAFVINYYLSRKLKTSSFEQILERFENDNIKRNLKAVYEDNKIIKQFNNFEYLTMDEINEIIGELSEYSGRRGGEENTTAKSIIDLSLELLSLENEDKLLDVGSGIGTTLLEASKCPASPRSPESKLILKII